MPFPYRRLALVLPLLVLDLPVFAQIGYPGQYPPGQYPPGQYPGGGYPGGGGLGIPRRSKKKKKTQEDEQAANLLQLEGMLRKLDEQAVVIEASDTRILNIKRSEKTKFLKEGEPMKPDDLLPGDHILVESTQDDEGFYYAVNVVFQKKGTMEERAAARQAVEISTKFPEQADNDDRPRLRRSGSPPPSEAPAPAAAPPAAPAPAPASAPPTPQPPAPPAVNEGSITEGDSGPPKLRRGKAKPGSKTSEPVEVAKAEIPPPAAASPQPAGPPPPEPPPIMAAPQEKVDPVILKAREAAASFTETLPAYVCQQLVARFVSTGHTIDWRPQDVVSTDVVYENGRESYRNIAINGKATNKKMEELPGSRSTGEFGTILVDVLSPSTNADFRLRKEGTFEGKAALIYDYTVEHDGSHWHIEVGSQSVLPPYRGAIWLDKKNFRVLRIEMEARNVPEEFPMDKIESAVDYDYVRFSSEQLFLLPVHAETLMCQRGTNICSRNTIDFRNYHKYAGESNITFGKQQ